MRKPNPLWHMPRWGFGSGMILAILYILLLFSREMNTPLLPLMICSPFVWFPAFLVGGLPGLLLGFIDGLLLSATIRNAPMPFTRANMQHYQKQVYASMGIATFLGASLLMLIFFNLTAWAWQDSWLHLLFPPIIAGIAAAYAGHRYLFRLQLWSASEFGLQKEKTKNVERLEDKMKHEEASFEEAHEAASQH